MSLKEIIFGKPRVYQYLQTKITVVLDNLSEHDITITSQGYKNTLKRELYLSAEQILKIKSGGYLRSIVRYGFKCDNSYYPPHRIKHCKLHPTVIVKEEMK